MRTLGGVLLTLALLAGACSSDDSSGGASDEGTTTTAGETTTTEGSAELEIVEGSGTLTAADGGVLVSEDRLFALYVPAGALAEDTELSVTEVASEDLLGPLAGAEIRGAVHEVQPDGLEFAAPVRVLRVVDLAEVGFEPGVAPVIDLISASDFEAQGDAGFEMLADPTVVDLGGQALVTGTTGHLSQFIASGDPASGIQTVELEEVPADRDLAEVIARIPEVDDYTVEAPDELPPPDAETGEYYEGHLAFVDVVADPFEDDEVLARIGELGAALDGPPVREWEPLELIGRYRFCDDEWQASIDTWEWDDRFAPAEGEVPVVLPIQVTPTSPDPALQQLGVQRPTTTIIYLPTITCDAAGGPVDATPDGQADGGSGLGVASATACVIHQPLATYPSHLDITVQLTGPATSMQITYSNGANGGQPVSSAPDESHTVDQDVGIPAYGDYDVIEALAEGTEGDTVDLTEAVQAALGSLRVDAAEGAVGNTPDDACN